MALLADPAATAARARRARKRRGTSGRPRSRTACGLAIVRLIDAEPESGEALGPVLERRSARTACGRCPRRRGGDRSARRSPRTRTRARCTSAPVLELARAASPAAGSRNHRSTGISKPRFGRRAIRIPSSGSQQPPHQALVAQRADLVVARKPQPELDQAAGQERHAHLEAVRHRDLVGLHQQVVEQHRLEVDVLQPSARDPAAARAPRRTALRSAQPRRRGPRRPARAVPPR